ncbi:hypothetical protein HMSSN139_04960 [Paenibacillus sp. HMSSN-139]|nr:hypothetical protein HMSSN139_04960 [Paenibacillus sp. HMSSN-139]
MAGSGDEAQDGAALKADAKPPADRLVSQIEELLQQNWGVDKEAVTVLGAANPNEDNAGR